MINCALLVALCLTEAEKVVINNEFVYQTAPFASCHASTIVETTGGKLLAAWFGGTREGNPDVGIWLARHGDHGWTEPVEVANGVQPDGKQHPCWNPVLFQPRAQREVWLFYKVGPSPQTWWGMLQTSADDGKTWSPARRLPDGFLGPIKNKPVQLAGDAILCPSSSESTEKPSKWRVHFELTTDLGRNWTKITPAPAQEGPELNAIQPSILIHPDGKLEAVGRTRDKTVFQTWSSDGGRSWSALARSMLPNPNSGTDAVTLRDGRHLIVYNHTLRGRTPINLAISNDGKNWQAALILEDEPKAEFSYPAIIQAADGLVHVTYTWKRQKVKHVVLAPDRLVGQPMAEGAWPQTK